MRCNISREFDLSSQYISQSFIERRDGLDQTNQCVTVFRRIARLKRGARFLDSLCWFSRAFAPDVRV